MKGFILGFQRFVWCPKCTPASNNSGTNSVVSAISENSGRGNFQGGRLKMLYHPPVRNLKFTGQAMSISPRRKGVFAAEPLALSVSQAKCEGSKATAAPIRRLDESSSSTHASFHRRRSKVRIQ